MVTRRFVRLLPILVLYGLAACDPAEDVRVQELPSLARASVEARLGLPELRGAWRFAGWELPEGDTLGLEAELPAFGIVLLQTQSRDSLAGFYLTQGGRSPLLGEVRRDSVVSLVTFPAPGDGRYLVGEVTGDTMWLEATSLAEPGSWRGDARAAFVRSRTPVTAFRRVRGAVPPPPPVDSAARAAADSGAFGPPIGSTVAPPGGMPAQPPGGAAGVARPPATGTPSAGAVTPGAEPQRPTEPRAAEPQPVAPPVVQPPVEAEPEPVEEEPEPEPEPVRQREPPRVLGEPVVRDTANDELP
ncbi:MAG TPA: hypothetical protein VFZ18_01515 [Longimicrobiaceae bacterium]